MIEKELDELLTKQMNAHCSICTHTNHCPVGYEREMDGCESFIDHNKEAWKYRKMWDKLKEYVNSYKPDKDERDNLYIGYDSAMIHLKAEIKDIEDNNENR